MVNITETVNEVELLKEYPSDLVDEVASSSLSTRSAVGSAIISLFVILSVAKSSDFVLAD